jgi:hypothetical protein
LALVFLVMFAAEIHVATVDECEERFAVTMICATTKGPTKVISCRGIAPFRKIVLSLMFPFINCST